MRLKAIFIFSLTMVIAVFSQTAPSIDIPVSKLSVGSPSFTDRSQYNSYDFCNSPLGIFEKDSFRVQVNCGVRYDSWRAASNSDSLQKTYLAWNVPDIMIGKPKIMYVRINYTPTFISDDSRPGQKLSLPLQRFGLTIAGQTPSGIFQMALRGKGFYGDETADGNPDTRLIMGLEDLSATIASRIHELVTIGMEGGATAKLDTLRDPGIADRYFVGQIPVLGWYIEFGKDGFPVASDFSLQIGTHRFVYAVTNGSGFDHDPIRGDSLAWKWQSIGNIQHNGIAYSPAFYLGYWSNHYQEYAPTADNNSLSVGPARTGDDWKISDLCWGIGTSVSVKKIVTAWFEFAHSNVGLDYGDAFSGRPSKNSGHDRICIGAEANLHAIPGLHFPKSIESFLRMGYFNQRENSGIGAFQSDEFGFIHSMSFYSMQYRYNPNDFGWGPDQRVMGFTIGPGATFLNRLIQTDAYVGFLSKYALTNQNGLELGVDCRYNLK
jgi:hypothetical protein